MKSGQRDLAESQGCCSMSLRNVLDAMHLATYRQWFYLGGLRTLTCVCALKFSPLGHLKHSEMLPWEIWRFLLPKSIFIASSFALYHPRKIPCQNAAIWLCVIYMEHVWGNVKGHPLNKLLFWFPEGAMANSSLCTMSKKSEYNQALTQQAWATWVQAFLQSHQSCLDFLAKTAFPNQ